MDRLGLAASALLTHSIKRLASPPSLQLGHSCRKCVDTSGALWRAPRLRRTSWRREGSSASSRGISLMAKCRPWFGIRRRGCSPSPPTRRGPTPMAPRRRAQVFGAQIWAHASERAPGDVSAYVLLPIRIVSRRAALGKRAREAVPRLPGPRCGAQSAHGVGPLGQHLSGLGAAALGRRPTRVEAAARRQLC